MEPQATRWSITPLFAKADKITNLSILYLFSFDDHDFSHDAGRYLRSVSSEVAEETNQSTKVSAQVNHMMSADVNEVLHD